MILLKNFFFLPIGWTQPFKTPNSSKTAKRSMPFVDSPGWERDWQEHPWTWDFEVSTVSDGHRVVRDKDKSEAKGVGAKLTFGEVLDCGVSRMLHNLGAAHKEKFHDLGMGPGKMLIQTYLQFFNLKCCMGVELARGRYELAENNVRTLLRVGWRGRKFMGVEFKKGEFMKIVELTDNRSPKDGWKIGDKVIAFHPFVRSKKEFIPDYSATIVDIIDKEKGLYKIKYNSKSSEMNSNIILNKSLERGIQSKYLFTPQSVRTLEIWYGSLFDYPDGFDAQICILETDFPDEMHPELIRRMATETPIGCTFLTYHNLKKFDCFDWNNLRQIDANVYDNDRYITSWSQGWRFYTWSHCPHQKSAKPYSTPISANEFTSGKFKIGTSVIFHNKGDANSKTFGVVEKFEFLNGKVLETEEDDEADEKKQSMDGNEIKYLTIKTLTLKSDGNGNGNGKGKVKDMIKEGTLIISRDEINNGEYVLYLTSFRHKVGSIVCGHRREWLASSENSHRFDTMYGRVIGCDTESLTYSIEFCNMNGDANGQYDFQAPETCVFDAPSLRFNIGDRVMACWPRNAQNKNCIHRYKRFPGQIIGINSDATYRIKYDTNAYLMSLLKPELYPLDYDESTKQNLNDAAPTIERDVAGCVREMWIVEPASFIVRQLAQLEQDIGLPFSYDVNLKDCQDWNSTTVLAYLGDIGLFNKNDENSTKNELLLKKCQMDGKQLIALADIVGTCMKSELKKEDDKDKDKDKEKAQEQEQEQEIDINNNNNDDDDASDEKVFSQASFQNYLKKVYNENESDDKSEENSNEFDDFALEEFDFKNLLFNLKHLYNKLNENANLMYDMDEVDEADVANAMTFDANSLRAAAQQLAGGNGGKGPIDLANALNFAQQIGRNGDAAQQLDLQNILKNIQHLQNTYPASYGGANDQDTDRKED